MIGDMSNQINPVPAGLSAQAGAAEVTELKIPPHSIEAEQAVLGAVFLDKDAWDKVAERVEEGDFYRQDHRLVFRAFDALSQAGEPTDIVTAAEWLENHQLLDQAGGMQKLAALADNTPSAANIAAYAEIVRKRSVLRQLISATARINEAVFNPQGKASEQVLDEAEQAIFEIGERQGKRLRKYRPIADLIAEARDRVDTLSRQSSPITGLATGYTDFDRLTAGLQPADLIILAGRPSMGKSALAINIAEHVAIQGQKSVAVFSMEMPSEQLAMRMIGSLSRIDQQRLRTGRLADEDWPRLTSTVGVVQDARLFIDDTPALSPAELRARARRIARDLSAQAGHKLDLVIVDYLQLMQVPGFADNRVAEVSEVSRALKGMAKELNVPVIALSQLNRGLEQRPNKRPVMSDLRESGAIEQDADVIVFIYRDEVYDKDSADKGIAEVIIAKQRNGPIGLVKLAWRGQFTRFEGYVEAAAVPAPPAWSPPEDRVDPGL